MVAPSRATEEEEVEEEREEEEEKKEEEMEEKEEEEGVLVRKSCHFLQLTARAGCAKLISILML